VKGVCLRALNPRFTNWNHIRYSATVVSMSNLDAKPPYRIELMDSSVGVCACCGHETKTISGFIHKGERSIAAYFVQWTVGRMAEHPPNIDIVFGLWGEHTTSNDRVAISLIHVDQDSGSSVMVVDATDRPVANGGLAEKASLRDEIVGKPIAKVVFDLVDVIYLQDIRLFK